MNTSTLNFDLFAMAKPKSRADLIVLADEALAALSIINLHLDAMFDRHECSESEKA